MKHLSLVLAVMLSVAGVEAKTAIVYYSFTNNTHTIALELQAQTGADAIRVEPAEEGIDYAANNYAAGSALIQAIRDNPDDAGSYPEIKPVDVNMEEYDTIYIGAPLWWSSMAAPLQTFLFHNGGEMAGKHVGLIVSSASSGISGVEADARRLIPEGRMIEPSLWIRSSQTADCRSLIADWLRSIGGGNTTTGMQAAETDMGVRVVSSDEGMEIIGEFEYAELYTLGGIRVLRSTLPSIATGHLAKGIYVAVIGGEGRRCSVLVTKR